MTHDLTQAPMLDTETHEWVFGSGRRIPLVAGGDDGTDPAPEGDLGTEQEAQDRSQKDSTAPPQQTTAKGQGAAPWAKDLEKLGINDPRFDDYLRTQWQPRMTQLEQEAAKYRNIFGEFHHAEFAAQLLTALDENPVEAIRYMVTQLGVDPIDLIDEVSDDELMGPEDPEDQLTQEQPYGDDLEAKLRELLENDPRIQYAQMSMTAEQEAMQDQALEDLLSGMEAHYEANGDQFNRDLFVHLLKAAEGDADAAYEAYERFHTPAKTPDEPPPTGGGQKGVTPRSAPQYNSIAEAVEAFASDQRAAQQRI